MSTRMLAPRKRLAGGPRRGDPDLAKAKQFEKDAEEAKAAAAAAKQAKEDAEKDENQAHARAGDAYAKAARAYEDEARKADEAGRHQDAVDLYGKAAEAHGEAVGEYQKAVGIDTFEKQLKEWRRKAVAHIAAAEAAAADGNHARAAREYREAAKAHLRNASKLSDTQAHERAAKELDLAADCHRYAGEEHVAAGDKPKAIVDFEAAASYYTQAELETNDPVKKKAFKREAKKAQAKADALK